MRPGWPRAVIIATSWLRTCCAHRRSRSTSRSMPLRSTATSRRRKSCATAARGLARGQAAACASQSAHWRRTGASAVTAIVAPMRRLASAFLAFLLAACTAARPTAPESEAADLVLYNGKVVTVDSSFTLTRAVAIRGDRIVSVGDDARVRALAGPATKEINLGGRTVIPGLMDGHLHNAGGGPGVALAGVRSIDELLAAVEARAKAAQPGEIIVSNSDWHEAQLREKRLPHRRELDRVAPKNPVVLVRGGHEFILNSAAFTHWSISKATVSPPGGEIGHDAEGELNGELVDT